jgi:diguanylate cyclase (GGDEF)-like protein
MNGRSPTRRTGTARRGPGARTLAEREAAVLAGEQASHLRREAADRREHAADRREEIADRRDAATSRREQDLLPREGAAKASARSAARLRMVNERLVLTTVDAQTRTEAAEQVTAAMSKAAQHDSLTGLPNRALLADRLEQALAFARRQGRRIALLFLDLDHFKKVNDTLGHTAGDLLLQSTARRLQACVRHSDTVCRKGGDEFVLLLSEIREVEDAIITARKVIAAMTPPHRVDGHRIRVTVSIGISLFPDDGADGEALVQAADIAMYQAKRSGRNSFQVFTRSMAEPINPGREPGHN